MYVKDKIKNAFITIIRDALSRPDLCRQVFFAAEKSRRFPGSADASYRSMTFILEGSQNTSFYVDGQLRRQLIEPGKVFFSDYQCPSAIEWEMPCKRLGIGIRENWQGMAWKSHRHPGRDVRSSDLWYSTPNLNSHRDLLALFDALAARAAFPGNTELTRQLPVMIMRKMLEILEDEEAEPPSSAMYTYRKICDYLEENCHLPINRKLTANLFNLNPDYVTRLFKEQGRTQFSDYLTALRMRRAEELLQTGELSVEETARRCGFSDPSYFIKVFRRKHAVSPGHYRSARD